MKRTFDYDFQVGEFKMKNGNPVVLTGIDALKLWIQKCIRTQLNRYVIYNGSRYGVNVEDLVVGKSYKLDFAESELRREIEAALMQNEDIQGVSAFLVENNGSLMIISFTIITIYGLVSEVYCL
jgi:hypothetical protein|nr:MAG TPA: Protein of unknown function (DUF2634) [Caudoviricetes sp.]